MYLVFFYLFTGRCYIVRGRISINRDSRLGRRLPALWCMYTHLTSLVNQLRRVGGWMDLFSIRSR